MDKTILILVVVAAFVAGTLTTATIVTAQSDTIIACVNNKSQGKDLRIVDSADECRNNETAVEWNIQGQQGEQGIQGEPGANGEDGDTGPAGTTSWTGLTDIPAGFADDIDANTITSGSCPLGFSVRTFTNGVVDQCQEDTVLLKSNAIYR